MKGLVFILIFMANEVFSVPIRCSYSSWNVDSVVFYKMEPDTNTKTIPAAIYTKASIALSYFPELEDLRIVFQFTKNGAPLETIPSLWSVFKKAKNRTYYISISVKTEKLFEPILFKNLSYDAQIGVLAHELSHVTDFQQYNLWNFIVHAIKYTFNSKYGDGFEYNTDMICIKHGAGYQLLAWSTDTHQNLDTKQIMEKYKFDMTRERYMYPESIKKAIGYTPFYNDFKPLKPCY